MRREGSEKDWSFGLISRVCGYCGACGSAIEDVVRDLPDSRRGEVLCRQPETAVWIAKGEHPGGVRCSRGLISGRSTQSVSDRAGSPFKLLEIGPMPLLRRDLQVKLILRGWRATVFD